MNINTTARHFDLGADDRSFAHERLEKSSRFAQDLQGIHLVVTAENSHRFVAEATMRLKHRELAVREEANDPRRAIELVADRVDDQLRRLHDRRVDHRRGERADGPVGPSTDAESDEFEGAGED